MISNFGEKLQKIRREKKINLDKVEDSICVQKKYLKAIEDGDFNKLPGEVYVKNFVRKYASFLGVPADNLMESLESDYALINEEAKNDSFGAEKKKIGAAWNKEKISFSRLSLLLTPKFFKNLVVILIFLFCFSYLGVEAKNVFDPPRLEIFEPSNNLVLNEQIIKITGRTEPGSKLAINDEKILIDNEGNFSENINLQPGVNVVKISANKKYGKTNISYVKVLVVEDY